MIALTPIIIAILAIKPSLILPLMIVSAVVLAVVIFRRRYRVEWGK